MNPAQREKGVRWVLFGICLTISLISPARAFETGGYYENDAIGLAKRTSGIVFGDMNRLRIKFDQKAGDNIALHLEPHYNLFIKSENIPLGGVSDMDKLVWDRVFLKYYSPLANLTVGKQRIAWGSGTIWNPTDVFNPFVMSFAVKEEETINVEAVRVEAPIGNAAGIDGYLLTGKTWNETKKGIRAKTTIGLFDAALSYVDTGTNGFQVGFDCSGDIMQAGVRNEIVLRSPAGSNAYIQSVWGMDYTLDNGVGLSAEYFFNGLGKKNKDSYDWAGLAAGNISQLGMDYLFLSANKIIDEITNIRCSLISNLDDLSYIIYPQYSRNVSQNVDLSLEGMWVGGQEGSEYYPSNAIDPTGLSGSKMALVRVIYSF
jgi:hypothetical protein